MEASIGAREAVAFSPADERLGLGGKADLRDPSPQKDDTRVGLFVQPHGRRVKGASTRSDRAGK
jgi:hypothetical protein